MAKKHLLYEDDAAPDAREYFDKDLLEKYGFTRRDFFERGERRETDDGLCVEYHLGEYILSFSGDDPYYKLERKGP